MKPVDRLDREFDPDVRVVRGLSLSASVAVPVGQGHAASPGLQLRVAVPLARPLRRLASM